METRAQCIKVIFVILECHYAKRTTMFSIIALSLGLLVPTFASSEDAGHLFY